METNTGSIQFAESNNEESYLLSAHESPYTLSPDLTRTMDEANFKSNQTSDALSKFSNPNDDVYRSVFFVVMPIFCGYATLFSMQQRVLEAMYGPDAKEEEIFSIAVSMLYVGNLVFRLGHNIFFGFLHSRNRVVLSMVSMIVSMGTIGSIFIWFRNPSYIWLVFIGYGFGGLAVGTFESNMLSMITPLGKDTKLWAIVAMPVGINVITIGGFLLLGFVQNRADDGSSFWVKMNDNPEYIHFSVMLFTLFGLAILFLFLYRRCQHTTTFSIKEFLQAFLAWRQWANIIKFNCVAMMFDMFCVSLFSPGVILYIYSGDEVQFTLTNWTMNSFWFIAIYNMFFFLGDSTSRKIFYKVKFINPFFFLILSVAGIIVGMTDITILVPLTALGVSFANGSLYTQTARLIDKEVPEKFNLVALSFWLFIGDIGSVVGSNLIGYISQWVTELYH